MGNGKLKIKESRKVELKVNSKEMGIPKEYDFSSIPHGTYDCDIELQNGKIINIVLEGKNIPKKDNEVQRKAEQLQKREQEAIALKEQEKKERETKKRVTSPQSPQQSNTSVEDCFDLNKAKVPKYANLNITGEEVDNFALKHFKFARFERNENDDSKSKFSFIKTERGRIIYTVKHNNFGLGNTNQAKDKFNKIKERHLNNAYNLWGVANIKSGNFAPDWRIIVGLGTDSVYETGITLHHIYGFPYIPASAIKGITNHYAQDNGFDKEESGYKQLYDKIFGSTNQKGQITFFDAMPVSIPQLKPDIMNVHYPKYYGEGQSPTDTQSPVPIPFITVEKTDFQFILGCKEDSNLLKIAFSWLNEALQNKGIGAKTAVGYGYMNPIS